MIGYLARIWRLRYFWTSLVRIDLRNRYRRSVLGIGWSLLHPILMTAVLCAVFCPLFSVDYRQFAPFLLAGLAFWNFLVSTAAARAAIASSRASRTSANKPRRWPSIRYEPCWARPFTGWPRWSWC